LVIFKKWEFHSFFRRDTLMKFCPASRGVLMSAIRSTIRFSFALLPLLLAGCGDGWTTQPYHGQPYEDRTAGSGIEYVRAHMAPPEALKTETKTETKVETPPPAPAPAPPPAPAPAKADEVFHKAIQK
jgi:hypothetical protein